MALHPTESDRIVSSVPTGRGGRAAPALAIVGGGLSGALVAIHLLRQARTPTRVVLIERRPPVGRGVAFGTECREHRLNVIAGRMSLFPEDPAHFLRWARARGPELGVAGNIAETDFLPRFLYGRYVAETLTACAAAAPHGASLELVSGEAVDIEETSEGARIILADRREIAASTVVLALGNLPGEYPVKRPLLFYRGPRYAHVPWNPGLMANLAKTDDVLIVGAGLTAVDIIVQLDQLGHRGTIHALSRRGFRPLAHHSGPEYPHFLAGETLPTTVLAAMRRLRSEVRRGAAQGADWRQVLDAIRPQTQALWLGFSGEERARFMRHARSLWEVHRHRLSPATAATVDRMVAEGRVKFLAGRLEQLTDLPTVAEAVFRRRGAAELSTLHVAKVINCTGPRTDYSKYQHPLLINLLARGLIDHDRLALGINALPTGEVLRYRAGPVGWLFTLGAPLKGVLWESTGAAEIRVQARALSEKILQARPKSLEV